MSFNYFLSDLHLMGRSDRNYQLLIHFFKNNWVEKPGNVFLLGDIFDLWVADHKIFIDEYHELIHILDKIKKQNYKVVYFEGNHDLHLTKFWQQKMGFEVFSDVAFFKIDNLSFRLEHGDLINQQDLNYLKLRKFLRTSTMKKIAFLLPGKFWDFIGKKWSASSRKKSRIYSEEKNKWIINLIRSHAERVIKEKYFDVIITGHMHVFDEYIFNFESKKIVSINLGSWMKEPKILVFETGKSIEAYKWIELNNN